MTATELLKEWLHGTTCWYQAKSIFWQSECGNFVVLKHHGHSEYIDRCSGTLRCGTYYAMYDLRKGFPNIFGKPDLMRWEGRWLKKYWSEVNKIMEEIHERV